jgi:hypothetical protein
MASFVTSHAAPDDLVVVNPWYVGITLSRYYRGRAPVLSVPPIDDLTVHRYDLVKASMIAADPIAPLLSRVQQVLMSGRHVWYIGTFDTPKDGPVPPLRPPPTADSGWSVVPYQRIWSQQLGQFLNEHVAHGQRVRLGAAGGPLEESPLNDLSGWR